MSAEYRRICTAISLNILRSLDIIDIKTESRITSDKPFVIPDFSERMWMENTMGTETKHAMNAETKNTLKHDGMRFLVVLAAAALMALNLRSFVRAGGLFPGGVTGLSVLIQRTLLTYFHLQVPYSVINLCLNAVPVYIGFRYIGKKFTLLSVLMIVFNSIMTDIIPPLNITYDTFLISLFGGMINGVCVSMCLRVDATSGGTDFLGIYLSQKKNIDAFNLVLGFNAVMLTVAGFLYGWEKALYSIVFQFVSTQTLHVLYRTYQQQTLFIISEYPKEVCSKIAELCHHSATVLNGEGAYEGKKKYVIYSVISGNDVRNVVPAIREVDPDAFVNSIRSTEIRGNFYLRPKD